MIGFIRQLVQELTDAADELDSAALRGQAQPGDTIRVVAMAILTASKKTLLA